MRSIVLWWTVATGLLVCVPIALATTPRNQSPTKAWAVWQWGASQQLTPAQSADLIAAGCDQVWRWVAVIELDRGFPVRQRRGGPLRGLDLPWIACVRIDPSCTPSLEQNGGRALFALVAAVRRDHPTALGIEIDWDVPSRLLPAYAEWMRKLRTHLPASDRLEATALVSWLDEPGFADLCHAVDLITPQCYALGRPAADATRIVGGGDPVAVTRRLGRISTPHRIGLATYEQTVVESLDGRLRSVAASLSAEEVLATGARLTGFRTSPERILDLRMASGVQFGSWILEAGDRIRSAQPDATALAATVQAVRAAAGPGFQGLAVFHLGSPGELPAFPAERLARVMVEPPALLTSATFASVITQEGPDQVLELANTSDTDQVWNPAFIVAIHHGQPRDPLPAGILATPARNGVACSPLRADGVLLGIPFLRAGTRLRIPLSGGQATLTP